MSALPRCEKLIGGKFVPSLSGEYFPLISPETEEATAEIANSTTQDVNDAVQTAHRALRSCGWRTQADLRIRTLRKVAEKLRENITALVEAESRVTGRPIREMRAQLGRLPEWYDYFASVAETMEDTLPPFGRGYLNYTWREPLGVVGLLTPWNHPLLILTKKLAPALAAGNAVVIKPSELAPVTINVLAELMRESGMPDGIVNVVHGFGAVAGKALAENAALGKLDLTGGPPTGGDAAAAGGRNVSKVEAGSIAGGQTCVQGAGVLVHDTMYDRFVSAFVDKVSRLRVGPPLDNRTDVGPLVAKRQLERVTRFIETGISEGATLAFGKAQLPNRGWYVSPTVFSDVTNDMTIAQEEIFGPVVCLMRYSSEKEAIELANGTRFGLGMAIWTNDVCRAHSVAEQLDAGIIWVNDHHRIGPASPWGGFKESGIGRENGIDCYKDYTRLKNVIVKTTSDSFDWFDGSATDKRYS